jgi:hypothetical protein
MKKDTEIYLIIRDIINCGNSWEIEPRGNRGEDQKGEEPHRLFESEVSKVKGFLPSLSGSGFSTMISIG